MRAHTHKPQPLAKAFTDSYTNVPRTTTTQLAAYFQRATQAAKVQFYRLVHAQDPVPHMPPGTRDCDFMFLGWIPDTIIYPPNLPNTSRVLRLLAPPD